jgi:hypothetical protein
VGAGETAGHSQNTCAGGLHEGIGGAVCFGLGQSGMKGLGVVLHHAGQFVRAGEWGEVRIVGGLRWVLLVLLQVGHEFGPMGLDELAGFIGQAGLGAYQDALTVIGQRQLKTSGLQLLEGGRGHQTASLSSSGTALIFFPCE